MARHKAVMVTCTEVADGRNIVGILYPDKALCFFYIACKCFTVQWPILVANLIGLE